MNEQSVSIPYELFIDTIYALGKRSNKKIVEQLKAAVTSHDSKEDISVKIDAGAARHRNEYMNYAVGINDIGVNSDVEFEFFSFDKRKYTFLAKHYKKRSYEYSISSKDDHDYCIFTYITIEKHDVEKYKVCFANHITFTSKAIIVTRIGLKNLIIRFFGPKNPLFVVDTDGNGKVSKIMSHLDIENIMVCFRFAETASFLRKENDQNVPRENCSNRAVR